MSDKVPLRWRADDPTPCTWDGVPIMVDPDEWDDLASMLEPLVKMLAAKQPRKRRRGLT